MKKVLASLVLALAPLTDALADGDVTRADDHAPIGVMADHYHGTDEVMFSYRFMRMSMDGNGDGTGKVSESEVLDDYMVAPQGMTTEMHMFGVMYAPSDTVTLMGMLPYIHKSMDHVTGMGDEFTTRASGSGDLKLTALIAPSPGSDWHFHLGASAPTGSILEADDTPMGRTRLPYGMQLGSGTWDVLAGVTLNRRHERGSWGLQLNTTWRTGGNDLDYRLGHEAEATGWGALAFTHWLSGSLRLSARQWGDISGEDETLNPNMVPTADPDLRAGQRLDAGAGFNMRLPHGALARHRLAVEYMAPLYQDLDGPQLRADDMLVAGWQYDFSL